MNIDELRKELCYKANHAATVVDDSVIKEADDFAVGYKKFLNDAKTEREATAVVLAQAIENGFQEFDPEKQYKAGDKIYYVNREKSIILAVIGKKSLKEGVKIAAALYFRLI